MNFKGKSVVDMNRTELEFQEVFELLTDIKKDLLEIQAITTDIWAKTCAMNPNNSQILSMHRMMEILSKRNERDLQP